MASRMPNHTINFDLKLRYENQNVYADYAKTIHKVQDLLMLLPHSEIFLRCLV